MAFNKNGVDYRMLPAYTILEASRYLQLPAATLRSWVKGRPYPTEKGQRFFKPIILLPDKNRAMLSFVNLIEAHVVAAFRRKHNLKLKKVRGTVEYLRRHYSQDHPLAVEKFETDGIDIFIQKAGLMINTSQSGQLEMREFISRYLERIERDKHGFAVRLYPFLGTLGLAASKVVVIDPKVSFGKPVLVGTGIPTSVIADRWKAGDSMEELARDYKRSQLDIEQAIRCELDSQAA